MTMDKQEREAWWRRAEELYQSQLRSTVETPENIGTMILIDLNSGDYEIDPYGLAASRRLMQRRPYSDLIVSRIGYEVTCTLPASLGAVKA
jgi:hypothetical protein